MIAYDHMLTVGEFENYSLRTPIMSTVIVIDVEACRNPVIAVFSNNV